MQPTKSVIDAIESFMRNSFVHPGASYPQSQAASRLVNRAHELLNEVVNGTGIGDVVLGNNTSYLCQMLAECYQKSLKSGDEIIVAVANHEGSKTVLLDDDVHKRILRHGQN